jgi:Domain of unknown function (DUF4173)
MNPATESIVATGQQRLLLATGAIVVLGWLGDFLFWEHSPGISVGISFTAIAVVLLVLGQRTRTGIIAACLLLAACFQSAIELCFTNIASLVILTIVLFGETSFGSLAAKWPRWSEALWAILVGPFQWLDLMRSWAATPWTSNGREALSSPTIGRVIRAAVPMVIFALIFATLLSSGNAILAEVFSRIGAHVKAWLLEISFERTVMWLVWLTVGVTFLWPKSPPDNARWWTREIPSWNRNDVRLAHWQSAMILGAVNALFFAANTIDVLYLWSHGKLPSGISYSQFVHQGVYSLIAAVLLAAATLAVLFQQQPAVARNSLLRGLAILWIAQNVVLILGVLRRLQLYVDAYQLSELRVYVACFLALVTVGFILLGWEIWKGMRLGRLFFGNAIATFVLFFILQFCDVGTWVANWNVSRWVRGEHPSIDVEYLVSLGPKGWPGLSAIALSDRNLPVSADARARLTEIASLEREHANNSDWRSYQARGAARRAEVLTRWTPHP